MVGGDNHGGHGDDSDGTGDEGSDKDANGGESDEDHGDGRTKAMWMSGNDIMSTVSISIVQKRKLDFSWPQQDNEVKTPGILSLKMTKTLLQDGVQKTASHLAEKPKKY